MFLRSFLRTLPFLSKKSFNLFSESILKNNLQNTQNVIFPLSKNIFEETENKFTFEKDDLTLESPYTLPNLEENSEPQKVYEMRHKPKEQAKRKRRRRKFGSKTNVRWS